MSEDVTIRDGPAGEDGATGEEADDGEIIDTELDAPETAEDMGRKRGANTSNEFHKKEVVDRSVKYVGRVENIFFDPHDWSITHLAVKLDREICKVYGLSKVFAKTCYLPVEMIETVGDRLLLNVTIDVVVEKSEMA